MTKKILVPLNMSESAWCEMCDNHLYDLLFLKPSMSKKEWKEHIQKFVKRYL